MTYHVVCHDCPFEEVHSIGWVAHVERLNHDELTGHDVEYAEVA